jgi:hypothetical protein
MVEASPLGGMKGYQEKVDGGTTKVFKVTFKGGERACVIVVGDHKPVVPLALKVEDSTGKLIGEDKGGRDLCAVIWYPARDGEYTIHIAVPHIPADEDYNLLTIALK